MASHVGIRQEEEYHGEAGVCCLRLVALGAHGVGDLSQRLAEPLSVFRDGERAWLGYLLFAAVSGVVRQEGSRVVRPVDKYDPRLFGTWQSDRRRTFRHFKPKPGCPPQSLRKLKAMFGKLVIRWGRGRYHTEYDGHRDSVKYEVVARDESSVVVRYEEKPLLGDRLQHIHFDEDAYWIASSGSLIEWFRRVR